MDEKLVRLYSEEYRKERKLNYQLSMDLQQCQMLMNEMNKDLSKLQLQNMLEQWVIQMN